VRTFSVVLRMYPGPRPQSFESSRACFLVVRVNQDSARQFCFYVALAVSFCVRLCGSTGTRHGIAAYGFPALRRCSFGFWGGNRVAQQLACTRFQPRDKSGSSWSVVCYEHGSCSLLISKHQCPTLPDVKAWLASAEPKDKSDTKEQKIVKRERHLAALRALRDSRKVPAVPA